VEPFARNEYETEARKALQKGDIEVALVWAALAQTETAKRTEGHLKEIGRLLNKIQLNLESITNKR
jgi:rubrerythrin